MLSTHPTPDVPGTAAVTHRRLRSAAMALSVVAATVAILLLPTTSSSRSRTPQGDRAGSIAILPVVHAAAETDGYWHAAGSRIEDAHNRPVRISGLNWSGLETTNAVPGGLDRQDYRAILHTVRSSGYNTVRIPFSNQMVETPGVPEHVAFTSPHGPINSDLRGLNSLEILDHLIAAARGEGLKVILDNHRSEAGSSAQESGLWYTDTYPEQAWIADWTMLARRYAGNSTVIGVDLRNEPHNAGKGGACWNCGGPTDWHRAAERAGNSVLRVNPRLLIFVEGVDAFGDSTTWWGGNLAGVRVFPVHLSIPGRLVYSAHVYGPAEYPQPWFNPNTTAGSLVALWRHDWAYISEEGIAPVWIGEFGAPNEDVDLRSNYPGSEGQWFGALVHFLQAHPAVGWTYWGLNGEDRYGLLDSEYGAGSANSTKALALASISVPLPGRSGLDTALVDTGSTSAANARDREDGFRPRQSSSASNLPTGSGSGDQILGSVEARDARRREQVARAWRADTSLAASPAPDRRSSVPNDMPGMSDAVAEGVRRATAHALDHLQPPTK